MCESEDRLRLPHAGKGDVVHAVVKSGISLFPYVGATATEIFSLIIAPPLSRRRDEWMEGIAAGLEEVEGKVEGFTIESLADNPMFITAVMNASQAAIKTHEGEKTEALRNAVLNSALPNAPEDNLQLMYLGFVDSLTTWHLRVLKFFDAPDKWFLENQKSRPNISMGGRNHVLEAAYPELSGRRAMYDQLVKDLYSRGLLASDSIHGSISAHGLYQSITTDMGRSFLQFITSPLVDPGRHDSR